MTTPYTTEYPTPPSPDLVHEMLRNIESDPVLTADEMNEYCAEPASGEEWDWYNDVCAPTECATVTALLVPNDYDAEWFVRAPYGNWWSASYDGRDIEYDFASGEWMAWALRQSIEDANEDDAPEMVEALACAVELLRQSARRGGGAR